VPVQIKEWILINIVIIFPQVSVTEAACQQASKANAWSAGVLEVTEGGQTLKLSSLATSGQKLTLMGLQRTSAV